MNAATMACIDALTPLIEAERRQQEEGEKDLARIASTRLASTPDATAGENVAVRTLARVRSMCRDVVVSSDIGKRVHGFALVVWGHIERSMPDLGPADWNELVTAVGLPAAREAPKAHKQPEPSQTGNPKSSNPNVSISPSPTPETR